MRVLIIGSGGREHALSWKVARSGKAEKIYCAPGNGGTAQEGENIPLKDSDVAGLVSFAKGNVIDFVIPGPELPLTLGVVAAALTDLDDRLAGRLRNLAITLVCFFIASASVELLFPWPPLFALGLTVSTIGFILLGGLGQRYATIAFGALLIAIYTMLGVTLYDHWHKNIPA